MHGAPLQANQIDPSAATLMPYGFESAIGSVISLISPVAGLSRPTMLEFCRVKNNVPLLSKISVCGSFAFGSGILYSVALPVAGSSLPIVPFMLPLYQGVPLLSSSTVCGFAIGGS